MLSSLYTNHSDLEISQFFNVSRLFVHKFRRELKTSDGNVESVAKSRKHKPLSDTVKTPQFVQQVHDIDEGPSKSIRAISRDLQLSE